MCSRFSRNSRKPSTGTSRCRAKASARISAGLRSLQLLAPPSAPQSLLWWVMGALTHGSVSRAAHSVGWFCVTVRTNSALRVRYSAWARCVGRASAVMTLSLRSAPRSASWSSSGAHRGSRWLSRRARLGSGPAHRKMGGRGHEVQLGAVGAAPRTVCRAPRPRPTPGQGTRPRRGGLSRRPGRGLREQPGPTTASTVAASAPVRTRHSVGWDGRPRGLGVEPGQYLGRHVGDPTGDRGERAHPAQHRGRTQRHHHRDRVITAPARCAHRIPRRTVVANQGLRRRRCSPRDRPGSPPGNRARALVYDSAMPG